MISTRTRSSRGCRPTHPEDLGGGAVFPLHQQPRCEVHFRCDAAVVPHECRPDAHTHAHTYTHTHTRARARARRRRRHPHAVTSHRRQSPRSGRGGSGSGSDGLVSRRTHVRRERRVLKRCIHGRRQRHAAIIVPRWAEPSRHPVGRVPAVELHAHQQHRAGRRFHRSPATGEAHAQPTPCARSPPGVRSLYDAPDERVA
jgi:hypothetical protein